MTGAASGIGRAIAERFVLEGASVVVADVDVAGAAEAANSFKPQAVSAVPVQVDVRSEHSVEGMLDFALDRFGRIDTLVNSAGVNRRTAFLDVAVEEWDLILEVNLRGTFLCGQAAARAMVRANRGGAIINIASNSIRVIPFPRLTAYAASKGGVDQLTRAMALELAPLGIRVNAIAPGITETALNAELMADDRVQRYFREHTPMGRLGRPEDVANTAVFLASQEAAYITGEVIVVDGGRALGGDRGPFEHVEPST